MVTSNPVESSPEGVALTSPPSFASSSPSASSSSLNVRSSSDAGPVSTSLPSATPPPLVSTQSAPASSASLPVPAPSTPTSSPASSNTSPLSTRRPKLVDGLLHSSCHQCKTTKVHHLVLSCRAKADPLRKQRQCRKKYCSTCLLRTYGLNLASMSKKELDEWVCPSCHDACCCAACKRTKEKAYQEQVTKMTTQAVVHTPHAPLTQNDLFRVKSLSDTLTGAVHQPTDGQEDGAQLHAQLAHLQQIHQMQQLQQLQQTLQLIQALSNNNQQAPQPAPAPSFQPTEPLPMSTSTSPAQRQGRVDASFTPNLIQPRSDAPSHEASNGADDTFGRALQLRIAALRQAQQQERGQELALPHFPTSIPSSACSTPNEMTQAHSSIPSFPRAMSHPAEAMAAPAAAAPAEEADVDYGAIATKLMTAASLATRIFQEQQSGKQQQMYQQQCRLQQAHEALQHRQQLQHQHSQVVPLSVSSSLGAHQAFVSRLDGQYQAPLPLAPALHSSAGARSYSSASGSSGASHASTMPMADAYSTPPKADQREALHQLQMNILQDQQRVQLQHLLDTQERIRQHSAHESVVSRHDDSFTADPPTKRQCQSLQPSDAMHQLQLKVEALQVEQRRLAQQEADDRRGAAMEDDGYGRPECRVELSPMNFLTSESWDKFQGEQSAEPQGWPLEAVEEEDEARVMRRVI